MIKKKILSSIFLVLVFCIPVCAETAEEYLELGNKSLLETNFDLAEKNFQNAINLNNNLIEAYNKLGYINHSKQKYEKALEYYNKALELDPKSVDIYNNLANVYSAKKENDKAKKYFNKALELDSNSIKAYNGLAYCYKYIDNPNYKSELGDSNKYIDNPEQNKTLEYYKKSMSIDASDKNPAFYLIEYIANNYLENKNYDKSLELYLYLSEKRLNSSMIYSKLAIIYLKKNMKPEYVKYLELLISLPKYEKENSFGFSDITSIANILISEKKIDEAINLYKKRMKLNPKEVYVYLEISSIYRNLNKFSESEYYLNKASEIYPITEDVYNHRILDIFEQIKVLKKSKNNDEIIKAKAYEADIFAEKYCKLLNDDDSECGEIKNKIEDVWKSIKYSNKSAYSLFKSGIKNIEDEKLDQAEKDLKRAIEINPKFTNAYIKLGEVYTKKGKNNLALNYYNQAIKISPKFAEAYNSLGYFYKNTENKIKALEYFQKSIFLDKSNEEIKHEIIDIQEKNLNKIFYEEKNYLKALNLYTELIKLAPDNHIFYTQRSLCYVSLGKIDLAENDIKKAIEIMPSDGKLRFSLIDFYLNQLFPIKEKNYNIKDIQNKIELIEKNIKEGCKLEKKEKFDSSKLIIYLKEEFKIEKTKEEKEKFDFKKQKMEKLVILMNKTFKGESNEDEFNISIKFFKDMFEHSNKDKILGELISEKLNQYSIFLAKNNKNIEAEKIIVQKNKLQKEINNSHYFGKIGKLIDIERIINEEILMGALKEGLMDILYDILNREYNLISINEKKENEKELELEKFIKKDPKNTVFLSELGLIKARLGKIDEGIELIKKAIDVDKNDYLIFYNLALIYSIKKETSLAIENLEKCFKIKPIFLDFVYSNDDENDLDNIRDSKEFKELLDKSLTKKMFSNLNDLFKDISK